MEKNQHIGLEAKEVKYLQRRIDGCQLSKEIYIFMLRNTLKT